MDVRISKLERISAALAFTARFVFAGAKNQLRKPVRESLLSNAARTVKEQARGKGAVIETLAQGFLKVLMTEQGNQRHA